MGSASLPELGFIPKKTHHRASAKGLGATLSSQHRSQSVFFHHSHAQPSILAWAQDCSLNPGVATELPEKPITGPAPKVRQRCCPRSIADRVFFHHSHALPSILAWQQDCSTQSCCGNRIAPPNPAVATGLLHPILLWQQVNLVIEIEFADATTALWSENAGAHPAGATLSTDFEIQNVRVLASQVVLDSALVESFNRVLLSGRSLVFSYPHAAVQRPKRRGGAQRHRGARLHKTHGRVCDLLGQRRGLQDPLAGQPGAGRPVGASLRCSWARATLPGSPSRAWTAR